MTKRAVIKGVGHYLPDRVVPNSYFESFLNTSDEWIRERSGIERRHFASSNQTTSDLAFYAAKEAIENSHLNIDDIDGVVVATSTPDLTFPSVATMVQAKLGMTAGFGFDIQAVCAGFIFAIANANALIISGQAERLLVVGSETFSRLMDWNDRSTCVLFGDGAGAVILAAEEGEGTSNDRGILSTDINSDGSLRDLLYVDGGVSTSGNSGKLRMQGNLMFRQAVEKLTATTKQCLKKADLTEREIDWMVPHQANLRIINAVANKMGVSMNKIILTIQEHGNTSAASIPLALSMGMIEGKLKSGDLIVSEAIGGGLAWGSAVMRI